MVELASNLSKSHRVDILVGEKTPPPRWPALWRFFLDPNALAILAFTLKNVSRILREKYDVVIPLNGGWQPAIIRLVTWLYGGKMVISGQSGMGWDDVNNLWCFPDAFVALSTQAKNWARKTNPFVKVVYIPNGVDLKKFGPKGPSFDTALKKPLVLCVGALSKTKRIDLVIKAVAKLSNTSLLVAAGGGDAKEEIEGLGQKLLPGRFQLISVPFRKMPEIYRAADIFVLTSMPYYSFEIVLVEAMATGLPVVANDDPIRREIIGNAGLLVDPTNVKEYSLSLRRALEKDWGDKPRKQAEKFDWDEIAASYEKLFVNL